MKLTRKPEEMALAYAAWVLMGFGWFVGVYYDWLLLKVLIGLLTPGALLYMYWQLFGKERLRIAKEVAEQLERANRGARW